MGSSRYAEAAGHWLDAARLASFAAGDPRRMAAQTNMGAAHVLLGQIHAAEDALAEAELGWMECARRVETADVAISGRSSAFHFRLASHNLQSFQDVQRRRLARYCEAGLAITRFDRLLAGTGAGGSVAAPLAALLADILGPRATEVRLLAASTPSTMTDAADSLYAEKAAELVLHHASMPREGADDLAILEHAVALTALLRPGVVHDDALAAECPGA